MMYLIGQLAVWLLLTAAFAGVAGWAFAAERAKPREEHERREREGLLRDLIRFSGDGPVEHVADLDAAPNQRLLEIKEGRIAELERALETARARSDELSGELAELGRRGQLNDPDAEELARLRVAEEERARTVDAEVDNVEDETIALQTWRLRYFEQRVKYLEGLARSTASTPAPLLGAAAEAAADAATVQSWAAREANARAAFLEDELRARAQATESRAAADEVTEAEPFAADADVDMLLRWRLLYLERRVAHLQAQSAAEPAAPEPMFSPDPDRWRWRAHYLEARVRHLEQRPAETVATSMPLTETPVVEPAPPRPVTPSRRAKPAVLASARNGAPDDLTLIDGVSQMQQTTLYALGVFHFDQIAAWSDENVAWVDQYLRLQGRIGDEEWREQAADLAREGPAAARRALQDEDA